MGEGWDDGVADLLFFFYLPVLPSHGHLNPPLTMAELFGCQVVLLYLLAENLLKFSGCSLAKNGQQGS